MIELTLGGASQSVAFATDLITLLQTRDRADTSEAGFLRELLRQVPLTDLDVAFRICLEQMGEYGCCHLIGALSSACRKHAGDTEQVALPVIVTLAEEIMRYLKTRMAQEAPSWHQVELAKYFVNTLEERLKEPPLLNLDSETKKRITDGAAALRSRLQVEP